MRLRSRAVSSEIASMAGSLTNVRSRSIWSEMAENLSVAPIRNCGHLPQEEQPEVVNKLLLDFLRGWNG